MKRTVMVTGGGQGIGRVVVQHLLEAGYKVSVLEVDPEAATELEQAYASKDRHSEDTFLITLGDVSREEDVETFLKRTVEKFGNVYGVVNNAGISRNKPLRELTLEEWNKVLGVNLTGPFLVVKHAAPYLEESQGVVVNICSTRALMSEPHTEAYSASKGGVLTLTHALAMSLGPKVRVNAISPGWIEVSAYRKASRRQDPQLSEADHAQHPVGRVGDPSDIARMVLFLLDPANSFITGQNFVIDGGMTKKMIYV
jgi:NAD(P)-dependent dehydrogenase (short-subunit alcohol dehydrogenase family)